jgi:hypothetical protein
MQAIVGQTLGSNWTKKCSVFSPKKGFQNFYKVNCVEYSTVYSGSRTMWPLCISAEVQFEGIADPSSGKLCIFDSQCEQAERLGNGRRGSVV